MARHGDMAEQLRAMLAFRSRPVADEPIVVEKTNWTVLPSNDNNPEDVENMRLERRLEIVPSIKAIRESIATGEVERNEDGQVVRIGSLAFSDGKRKERAFCYGPEGKLVLFDATMPVGAMLNTKEKSDAQAGASEDGTEVSASNDYFAEVFGVEKRTYITGKRKRRSGKSYTADESRATLAEAWANTDASKVHFTKCAPGLPSATRKVADCFNGMKIGVGKGNGGSTGWEDIATSIVNREMWMETVDALSKDQVETLDYASVARNMREIGQEHGFVGKRAERMGKRILSAANDNLRKAMKSAA